MLTTFQNFSLLGSNGKMESWLDCNLGALYIQVWIHCFIHSFVQLYEMAYSTFIENIKGVSTLYKSVKLWLYKNHVLFTITITMFWIWLSHEYYTNYYKLTLVLIFSIINVFLPKHTHTHSLALGKYTLTRKCAWLWVFKRLMNLITSEWLDN